MWKTQDKREQKMRLLCYYCGDNVKHGLLSKNLFRRMQQHDGWENFSVTINFYEKEWLLVFTWNKKHSSKQVVSITYPLKKKIFSSCYFWGFVCSFFLEIVKKLVYTLVCKNHFYISGKESIANRCYLWEANLVSCL